MLFLGHLRCFLPVEVLVVTALLMDYSWMGSRKRLKGGVFDDLPAFVGLA